MLDVQFSANAWKDFQYWLTQDKKTAKRVVALLDEIMRTPFEGIGKPEPLRGDKSGLWSRRIDERNRLVYRVTPDVVSVEMLRTHYGD